MRLAPTSFSEMDDVMSTVMNTQYRKPLPGTALDYFDTREAIEAIAPGAYAKLPYTSRV